MEKTGQNACSVSDVKLQPQLIMGINKGENIYRQDIEYEIDKDLGI